MSKLDKTISEGCKNKEDIALKLISPDTKLLTFQCRGVAVSRIDKIFASKHVENNFINNLNFPEEKTNHCPVLFSIGRTTKTRTNWKMHLDQYQQSKEAQERPGQNRNRLTYHT